MSPLPYEVVYDTKFKAPLPLTVYPLMTISDIFICGVDGESNTLIIGAKIPY